MYAADQRLIGEGLASAQCVGDPTDTELPVAAGALINGVWQRHDLTLPVTDPEDGRLLGYVADSSPEDVAAAVTGVLESLATR